MNSVTTFLTDTDLLVRLLESASIAAAAGIGFIGVLIMVIGTVKGFGQFVIFSHRRYELITEIRIDIAKHLSLGLEFLVAKDIIKTIITPTLDELTALAFLVAIRTAIAYILAWEMKGAVAELKEEQILSQQFKDFQSKREKQETEESMKEM